MAALSLLPPPPLLGVNNSAVDVNDSVGESVADSVADTDSVADMSDGVTDEVAVGDGVAVTDGVVIASVGVVDDVGSGVVDAVGVVAGGAGHKDGGSNCEKSQPPDTQRLPIAGPEIWPFAHR